MRPLLLVKIIPTQMTTTKITSRRGWWSTNFSLRFIVLLIARPCLTNNMLRQIPIITPIAEAAHGALPRAKRAIFGTFSEAGSFIRMLAELTTRWFDLVIAPSPGEPYIATTTVSGPNIFCSHKIIRN